MLFQPGLTNSRLQYIYMAASLASAGYAVVTMDHTFKALVVEYPDGTYTEGVPESYWEYDKFPNDELMEPTTDIRIADALFVLKELGQQNVVEKIIPGQRVALDIKRTAMFGHSFGGAAALASLTREGTPFTGAINLDG